MKKIILLLLLVFEINLLLAQEKVDNLFTTPAFTNVQTLNNETKQFIDNLASARLLAIDQPKYNLLLNKKNAYTISIPTQNRGNIEVELTPATITSPAFKVRTQDGEIPFKLPSCYWGRVLGVDKSFVALTITDTGIEGIIDTENYRFTIGKIKDNSTNLHIIYETNDIPVNQPFETEEPIEVDTSLLNKINKKLTNDSLNKQTNNTSYGCRMIEIYMEADYSTYLDLGSNTNNVVNYVAAIFNNVAKLYVNEGISIVLSNLSIWTTTDRYVNAGNSLQALYIFDGYSFTGDLAHLLSTRSLGGGVAYISSGSSVYGNMTTRSVLQSCSPYYAYGVSGNLNTAVVNIPTYSWNVGVIAHELGHNFGLPHTHSCTWPGGAIDNCGPSAGYYEGSCSPPDIPYNTGTIMSYCHITNTGINFAYGFGTKPGDKLRAEVTAATCLGTTVITAPTVTSKSRCGAGSLTLNAANCTNGTLNWYASSVSTTVLGTGTSFTTPNLTTTTTYHVECLVLACSSTRTPVTATITSTPAVPTTTGNSRCGTGTVTLNAGGCSGGIINWYAASAGGNSLGTGTSFITPSISSSTTYYVSCTVGSCVSASRSSVIVTVTSAPAAPTATNKSRCGSGTVALSASGCSGGTINWYSAANGGSLLGSGANFTTPNISANTTYYVGCTLGNCLSNRLAVTATIIPAPAVPGATDKSRCGAGTVALSASGCSGGTINWYSAASGGSSLGSGANFTTPNLSVTTTYYVSCTIGSCVSGRAPIKAIISTNPAAPGLTSGKRCGTGTVTLMATGCSGGTINWYNTLSGGSSLGTGNNFTTPGISTTTTYYASCTVGLCTSGRASVVATINTPPAAPATTSRSRCGAGTVTLNASGCTGGTINWYAASSGGSSLGTGTSFITPGLSSTTAYYSSCTVGTCTSSRTVATATLNINLSFANINQQAGTYAVSQTITSKANVSTLTNYFAGKSITLSPGFQAGASEVFIARIQDCQ
ncbi:Ig-like domain-containing protein [Emticicia agri]|uniref:Peptidase M12B domain-containing protein n=1 Tax=Emticicia agri TaxID=2492393 RepID=A0A4Q5M506_9BACT|nr:M12 family metallo-peptidase [Emticicia agri]RYU97488.1 hypothetical protein EWM59_02010 [Emticicia agri]